MFQQGNAILVYCIPATLPITGPSQHFQLLTPFFKYDAAQNGMQISDLCCPLFSISCRSLITCCSFLDRPRLNATAREKGWDWDFNQKLCSWNKHQGEWPKCHFRDVLIRILLMILMAVPINPQTSLKRVSWMTTVWSLNLLWKGRLNRPVHFKKTLRPTPWKMMEDRNTWKHRQIQMLKQLYDSVWKLRRFFLRVKWNLFSRCYSSL